MLLIPTKSALASWACGSARLVRKRPASGWLLASLWESPACRGRRKSAREFESHQARISAFHPSVALFG